MKRVLTGFGLLAIGIPAFALCRTWFTPALLAVISALAAYEILNCIGLAGIYRLAFPLYFYAAALPPLARLCHLHGKTGAIFTFVSLIVLVLLLYLFVVMTFSKGKLTYGKITEAFMTVTYTSAGFTGMVFLTDVAGERGIVVLILIFVLAFSTDVFAYVCGRLFGKHKLIPEVSPKKTVEGSIGGIVFCVLLLLGYGVLLNRIYGESFIKFPVLLIGGAIASVVAQVGDLIMSYIKRTYQIKDFGWILPGHGGIMDRFDSAVAVSVIMIPIVVIFGLFK